jgi:hypothetical protein
MFDLQDSCGGGGGRYSIKHRLEVLGVGVFGNWSQRLHGGMVTFCTPPTAERSIQNHSPDNATPPLR